MATLEVIHWPDPRLSRVARPVAQFDDELRAFVADLRETMYAEGGIGIAAPQVADTRRLFLMDCPPIGAGDEEEAAYDADPASVPAELLVFINPIITSKAGSIIWPEGCLSVPGIRADVERADEITVEALDLDGQPFTYEARGLRAVCVQHELDHLDGVVFIDYLGPIERKAVMETYKAEPDERADRDAS